MNLAARGAIGLLVLAILCGSALVLLHAGVYGLTIFLVHPFLLGGLTSWVLRPSTGWQSAAYAFLAVAAVVSFLFLIGIEGAICILLTMPITVSFSVLGAYVTRRSMASPAAARSGLAMLLLLPPASFTFDTHAQPAVYQVHTAITIAAPPEQVWKHIVHLSTLPEPSEWYFRAGMAYPTQAHIEGTGLGATRFCEFSTGPVVESIDIWDAPRLMHFRVTETPAAMREWSPYGEISKKHLHGYFISRAGEFRLTPLPGNRTLLEGTSWYQHGLWPAQYWRWWSDALVHRIHLRVFQQIKTLAEAGAQ